MIRSILYMMVICGLKISMLHAQSSIYTMARDYQSPRSAAMGGYLLGILDDDVSLFHFNPALLSDRMHGQAMIHQSYLYGGVRSGSVSYAHALGDTTYAIGMAVSYMDYGDFTRTDHVREVQGSFSGGEVVATASISKKIVGNLRVGLSAKYLSSRLAEYTSHGMLLDVGVSGSSGDQRSTWSIVLHGVGGQLTRYDNVTERVPVDIQLGWTYRLRHLPFWLSLAVHDIDQWHLDRIQRSGTVRAPIVSLIDDLMRHVTIGGELRLGKNENVTLRLGYNHRQNRELSNDVYRGYEGISYGVGIGSSRLRVDYGSARYHLAGSVHHLGLRVDVGRLIKKF